MKAYVNIYGSERPREIPLASALEPEAYLYHDGAIEEIKLQVEENKKAIGAIAALLVEKGIADVDEIINGYRIGVSVVFK